jgi:hypothetical protein
VTGTSLLGGGSGVESVSLDGIPALEILEESETAISFRAGVTDGARTGDIVVVADTGAVIVQPDAWEYLEPANVSDVSPSSGQVGTEVVVTGERLLAGGSTVVSASLAGVDVASIDSSSDSKVELVANASSSGVGDLIMVSDSGGIVHAVNAWTYLEEGSISSITPDSGLAGMYATIVGERLRGGGGEVVQVEIAGVPIVTLVSENDTVVVVRPGVADEGLSHVVITSDSGAIVTGENLFTYDTPGEISSVTPGSGQFNTYVSITGDGMRTGGNNIVKVELAGVEATLLSQNDTHITVIAAASSGFDGDEVRLFLDTGVELARSGVWFYQTEGVIDTVTPENGQQGTKVTLAGSSLLANGSSIVRVDLAGLDAEIDSDANDEIVVIAGDGDAGAGDIVLYADTQATITLSDGFTYLTKGAVASVEPSSGQVGTEVVIRGERLRGGGSEVASVTLGGVEVASIGTENDTFVQVAAAAGDESGSAEDVVLTADTGAVITASEAWSFIKEGAIDTVSPGGGQGGTAVTIFGTGMLGGGSSVASISLVGVPCADASGNDTVAYCNAQSGTAGSGDVIIVSDTGAIVTAEDGFVYASDGEISSVTPDAGQAGTYVTIRGSTMLGGGEAVELVRLAGVAISAISDGANDTLIVVRPGSGSEGAGDVDVVSDTGSVVTLADGWTYNEASSIDKVQPSSGQAGTEVTISGSLLFGAEGGNEVVSVTFSGVEAEVTTGDSETNVVAIVASGSAGQGDVVVTADSGATATATNGWEYIAEGEIEDVSPAFGQVGTIVVLTGSNLLGGGDNITTATLAGVEATVSEESNDRVVLVAASADAATGSVKLVANTGAVVEIDGAWEYRTAGVIEVVTPDNGQVYNSITIFGTSLRGHGQNVSQVSLAGVDATIDFENDTMVVVIPGEGGEATGDVILTSLSGATVILEDSFTYNAVGSIDSIQPTSGQVGTIVTVFGSDLRSQTSRVASVTLGGVHASDILSENDTVVTFIAGEGPTANTEVDVVVIADTGTTITLEGGFTYLAPGTIEDVDPSEGRAGAEVTIFGFNMCGGGTQIVEVTLVGLAADLDVADNCGRITVTANDYGANATGDVAVKSDTGSVITAVDAFTYLAEGSITSVVPNAGTSNANEDPVVIKGSRLLGGGERIATVEFAGVEGFVVSSSDTEVQARPFEGPDGGGAGDVVLTSDTGVVVRAPGAWTYSSINSITPDSGQRGTVVDITGVALFAGGSEVDEVRLGGVIVSNVVSANETHIRVIPGTENVVEDHWQRSDYPRQRTVGHCRRCMDLPHSWHNPVDRARQGPAEHDGHAAGDQSARLRHRRERCHARWRVCRVDQLPERHVH